MKNGILNMGHVSDCEATALQQCGFMSQYKTSIQERIRILTEASAEIARFDSSEELLHNDMLVLYESEVEREDLIRAIKKLSTTPPSLIRAMEDVAKSVEEFRESFGNLLRGSHGAEA